MSILSMIAILASLLVVTASNTVLSIIWLVVVFLLTALCLSILGLGYAALTYVLVYVGAIAILFLFVVQLLDQRSQETQNNEEVNFLDHTNSALTLKNTSSQGILTKEKDIYSIPFLNGGKWGNKKSTFLFAKGGSTPLAFVFVGLLLWVFSPFIVNLKDTSKTGETIQGRHLYGESSSLPGVETLKTQWTSLISKVDFLPSQGTSPKINPALDVYPMLQDSPLLTNHLNTNISLLNKEMNSSLEAMLTYKGQIVNLGEWLYGGGSIALVIISIVLLLAMIGPIVLCWRDN